MYYLHYESFPGVVSRCSVHIQKSVQRIPTTMTDPYTAASITGNAHDFRHTDSLFAEVIHTLKNKVLTSRNKEELIEKVTHLRFLNEDAREQARIAHEEVGCYKQLLEIAEQKYANVAVSVTDKRYGGGAPITPSPSGKGLSNPPMTNDGTEDELIVWKNPTPNPNVTESLSGKEPIDVENTSINLLDDDKENHGWTTQDEDTIASNNDCKPAAKKKRKSDLEGSSERNPKELILHYFKMAKEKMDKDGVVCLGNAC